MADGDDQSLGIATLTSLIECDVEVATEALRIAGGNTDLAIGIAFDLIAAGSGSVSHGAASSCSGWVQVPSIDLDEDDCVETPVCLTSPAAKKQRRELSPTLAVAAENRAVAVGQPWQPKFLPQGIAGVVAVDATVGVGQPPRLATGAVALDTAVGVGLPTGTAGIVVGADAVAEGITADDVADAVAKRDLTRNHSSVSAESVAEEFAHQRKFHAEPGPDLILRVRGGSNITGQYIWQGDFGGKPCWMRTGKPMWVFFWDFQTRPSWWIAKDRVPFSPGSAMFPGSTLPTQGVSSHWMPVPPQHFQYGVTIKVDSGFALRVGAWSEFTSQVWKYTCDDWASKIVDLADAPSLTLTRQKQDVTAVEELHRLHYIYPAKLSPQGSLNLVGDLIIPTHDMLEFVKYALQAVRFPAAFVEFYSQLHFGCRIPPDICGEPRPLPFALLDNSEDPPSPQPPHFCNHLLRPEQLRSLGWMLNREGRAEGGGGTALFEADWRFYQQLPGFKDAKQQPIDTAILELRASARYETLGGILADSIGYGKTATTIGLIDSTLGEDEPEVPALDQGKFIPSKATLIIAPSNLFDQWLSEFGKFCCGGTDLKTCLRTGGWTSSESCPLKILAIPNVTNLTKTTAVDIANADVVLCTYRLLYSAVYEKRRKDISGSEAAEKTTLRSIMTATSALLKGEANIRCSKFPRPPVKSVDEMYYPILEMFYWKRIVYDEFHELESFDNAQQNILQHMRAVYRWGLTGTPPVDSFAGVIFMSSLFRVDLPGQIRKMDNNPVADLSIWNCDRIVGESAAAFLDVYARQNTAVVPNIKVEEHVEIVTQSSAERALYLGQAHEAPDFSSPLAFATPQGVQGLEQLLSLCSHFEAGASKRDRKACARTECIRVSELKERKVVEAKNRLKRCLHTICLLEVKTEVPSDRERNKHERTLLFKAAANMRANLGLLTAPAVASREMDMLLATVPCQTTFEHISELDGHVCRHEEIASKLGLPKHKQGHIAAQWHSLFTSHLGPATLQRIIASLYKDVIVQLEGLRDAIASEDFFKRMMAAISANTSSEARSCSVCMDEDIPLDRLAITPCAHTFCVDCLRLTQKKFKECSICRQPLNVSDISPISHELQPKKNLAQKGLATESAAFAFGGSSSSTSLPCAAHPSFDPRFSKYGSKLAVIVKRLQTLRAEDPKAKVILFVQFEPLKIKVADALTEFGVGSATLKGGTFQRANVIRDWQKNENSNIFVLVLSLQQSASGSNLTSASHVVFVHPMLAKTAEEAARYEQQAIGRARRFGQQRDTVHIWRFVTAGTLEQTITQRNQAALWENESARAIAATQAATSAHTVDEAFG